MGHFFLLLTDFIVFSCSILIHRNYLLKKRLSKGPDKIVLSAADFVFPIDTRRVSWSRAFSIFQKISAHFALSTGALEAKVFNKLYSLLWFVLRVYITSLQLIIILAVLPFTIVSSFHVYLHSNLFINISRIVKLIKT